MLCSLCSQLSAFWLIREAFHSHLFLSRFIIEDGSSCPIKSRPPPRRSWLVLRINQDQAVYIFEAYSIPSVYSARTVRRVNIKSSPLCFRMLHLSSVLASKRFESNSHAVTPLKGRRYPIECSTVHLCAEYVKTDLVISEKRNMDCKKNIWWCQALRTEKPTNLKKDSCHLHKIMKYFGFVLTKVDRCAALKEKRG